MAAAPVLNDAYYFRTFSRPEFRRFASRSREIMKLIELHCGSDFDNNREIYKILWKVDVSSHDIADWNKSLDEIEDKVLDYIAARKT